MSEAPNGDRMVFLGSGGARIVVARQLRASGGIWLCLDGTRLLVDPGPGSLVRMTASRYDIKPAELDAVLLSHRHLDHSGDVNNVIEAMTMGGTAPRGSLFAPSDALEGDDPVVLRYLRGFLDRLVTVSAGTSHRVGPVEFSCPVRHDHRGEVYGFRFSVPGLSLSYIADTRHFPALADAYRADVVILNVVRCERSDLDHLDAESAVELVRALSPRLAIISHFGMQVIRAKPWVVAAKLAEATGVDVTAASDGRLIDLAPYRGAA